MKKVFLLCALSLCATPLYAHREGQLSDSPLLTPVSQKAPVNETFHPEFAPAVAADTKQPAQPVEGEASVIAPEVNKEEKGFSPEERVRTKKHRRKRGLTSIKKPKRTSVKKVLTSTKKPTAEKENLPLVGGTETPSFIFSEDSVKKEDKAFPALLFDEVEGNKVEQKKPRASSEGKENE